MDKGGQKHFCQEENVECPRLSGQTFLVNNSLTKHNSTLLVKEVTDKEEVENLTSSKVTTSFFSTTTYVEDFVGARTGLGSS